MFYWHSKALNHCCAIPVTLDTAAVWRFLPLNRAFHVPDLSLTQHRLKLFFPHTQNLSASRAWLYSANRRTTQNSVDWISATFTPRIMRAKHPTSLSFLQQKNILQTSVASCWTVLLLNFRLRFLLNRKYRLNLEEFLTKEQSFLVLNAHYLEEL